MRIISISPGHYAKYPGVEKNGFSEYYVCKDIVDRLRTMFDKRYKVYVVEGVLKRKVDLINRWNPDLAIEIHLANTNSTKTSGSRSFHMAASQKSRLLSKYLLDQCLEDLGTEDKGSFIGWYRKISPSSRSSFNSDIEPKIDVFLSGTNCTAAIIEPFYISSSEDCRKFITDEGLTLIAQSIFKAIEKFYDEFLDASKNSELVGDKPSNVVNENIVY